MRVLVAGAGAIGSMLGARLQLAGHDVTLLGRPRLAEAVAARGLQLTGHTEFSGPIRVVTEVPSERFDAVWLTCKAHQTASLGAAVAPLVAEGGVLASLQNGLGNGEKLAALLPADRVAVCLTSHGVHVPAPGEVVHAGLGATKVGPVPLQPEADGGARVAASLLADADLAPVWCSETRGHVWQKAIVNAGLNPVGALYGVRNGEVVVRDDLRNLSAGLVREAMELARLARVDLPPGDLVEITQQVCRDTAENRCSMLQDVTARRVTEIEQITGRMVRLCEQLLGHMPRNESVYGRIKDLEAEYLGGDAELSAFDELQFSALTV